MRAAVADHEARWAAGATSSGPAGGGTDGRLQPPFDDALVREAVMPGVREEMRKAVDERMRPLLAELKARTRMLDLDSSSPYSDFVGALSLRTLP